MRASICAATLAAALLPTLALASPISAGFPPPGATAGIFSSTGSNLADATGKTRIYDFTLADTSQWSELYFDITGGQIHTNAQTLNFDTRFPADGGSNVVSASWSGNTINWNLAPLQFFDAATSSNVTVNPSLLTTFFQANGTTAIPSPNFSFSTPGDGMPIFVLSFSPTELAAWGNGFQVRQNYQISGGPLATFLNNNNGGAGLTSSTSGGFWYDPPTAAEVPEPASLVLLGSGCLALARRRRNSRA